jgi:hypothetical protein
MAEYRCHTNQIFHVKSAVPSLSGPNPKFLEQKFRRVNATGGPKSMGPRAKI